MPAATCGRRNCVEHHPAITDARDFKDGRLYDDSYGCA